jgi:hypothetical protein
MADDFYAHDFSQAHIESVAHYIEIMEQCARNGVLNRDDAERSVIEGKAEHRRLLMGRAQMTPFERRAADALRRKHDAVESHRLDGLTDDQEVGGSTPPSCTS